MEEQVGELWHRLITRLADDRHLEAGVRLAQVQRPLNIYFRALGGDGGLQIEAADATACQARRNWLQRIAGLGRKVELAWRDQRSLRLPGEIAWFGEASLNRDLYYWLAALAVGDDGRHGGWFNANQTLSRKTLERFPGLRPRYERLVQAHLAQRPAPETLKHDEAQAELAVRAALERPGSMGLLPTAKRPPFPVPLWLHPDPPLTSDGLKSPEPDESGENEGAKQRNLEDVARRQAERVKEPEADRGLVTIRMENILTMGEFVNVDRGTEDEEDLDQAEAMARELDRISVSRGKKKASSRLRFDLDLPGAADDDLVLDEGQLLPEWDWRKQQLQPNHCRIISLLADKATPVPLPNHLKRTAKKLRNQFQALAPARIWYRGQADGEEVDIDAYLRFVTDKAAGRGTGSDGLYREMRSGARDLACLLLADLSLSTDSWINDHHRVIDVIRDSLFLFAESLAATGDRFAILGFSSRKRDPVRVHSLKGFGENYGAAIRGRIQVIKPGYYTRMGAAIRHATGLLNGQPAGRRLLLILTDGKPNDLDKYEGRYGIEDTRHAVQEARRTGLEPFCVTIDRKGNDYLPHLFGSGGYLVIGNPAELPKRLPMLYARLTA
ncbi:MAG: VWA domain-containing protein [Gammaproteobacteria bacterium]|nr:VWA domain-containing protein [Gammaproteobacteria bacterium]MBU1656357.1 VWA domain-containing protein [Gammaproteobacteria bacterium]MBU1959921.1 VWA domain-containing protein [Gammaproteobacteria bacterium]